MLLTGLANVFNPLSTFSVLSGVVCEYSLPPEKTAIARRLGRDGRSCRVYSVRINGGFVIGCGAGILGFTAWI